MRTLSLLMGLTLALVLGSSGFAADVYEKAPGLAVIRPAAPPPWTSCYFGFNIGYGWGRPEIQALGGSTTWASNGAIGGGQVGCDYELIGTGLVVGVRDMFSMTGMRNSATVVSGPLAGSTIESSMKWVNTLTGRVGFASTFGMLYVHGGGAWSRFNIDVLAPGGAIIGQVANNEGGYDIGVGWEIKSAPNWSAFVEYNYMNFGTSSATTSTGVNVNIKKDLQNVMVGINWRL